MRFGRPLMGSSDPGSMPTELFGDEGDGNFNQVAVKTIQFRYQSGVQARGSGPRLMACRTQSLGHEPHQALPPAWTGLGLFRAWPGWARGLSLSLAHHYLHLVNNFNITHDEATQRLIDLWQAQNAIDIQEWDAAQIKATEQEYVTHEQRQQEEEDAHRAKLQEEEEALKEERKKHCTKFLPFTDVPPPSTIPITPSPLALRKLHKGEFVQLYFFTNKGLADVQSTSHSIDEDAFTLMPDEKGLHAFVPIASAKAKQSIIEDQDLTWAQVDEATHRMLQAMKEADWPQDHLDAMFHFWINLGTHKWQHDMDESACQVLIFYQATYWRHWHDTLGTPSSFNHKHIDQDALIRIKAKIIDQKYQATEKHAKEASSLFVPLPPHPLTNCLSSPHIFSLHGDPHILRFHMATRLHIHSHQWIGPTTQPLSTWHHSPIRDPRTLGSHAPHWLTRPSFCCNTCGRQIGSSRP